MRKQQKEIFRYRYNMSHEPLLTVFVKLKSRLLTSSARLLGNRDDASDAVQEAFCRLWPIRERITSEEEAAAMAVRTAQNICIDRLRHDRAIDLCDLAETRQVASESSPQREVEARESFLIVRQLIDSHLSALQKTILEMKEFDGYEIDEIAQKLQMQPIAVRMNLSRARKEIRTQYNSIVGDDEGNR